MKAFTARHKLMAALMITSQLLLTGFVLYWLWGQYRGEKILLQDQLQKAYSSVEDQLLDSVLMQHLVIPSLDDSVTVRIHEQESRMEETEGDTARVVVTMQHLAPPGDVDAKAVPWHEALPHDTGIRSIDVTSVITDEERMVRSVKLFIDQNPLTFQSDTGVFIYALSLDSAALVENMERTMEEKDWNFSLAWPEEDAGPTGPESKQGIVIGGTPFTHLPALEVNHYRTNLIRAILPQILFGLVLLLLTGSAFLFTYRSLLRQLALNRLRDDFIGNISHELKTPVSTVKIALEALQTYDRQKDPKISADYLKMAASELDRLEQLVGKVLHHEMLNNPALVLDREVCDLVELVRGVVRNQEIPIREAGATVTLPEGAAPCRVEVDRVYVEGMITNLLDNSLKYAGKHPEIRIEVVCNPRGPSLSVTDNGPGIPEEYRDQVFEKFFRIPAGNRHDVKGYGLGLNFVSQVMEKHGGTIDFRNLPEGGCRFTLQFPGTPV